MFDCNEISFIRNILFSISVLVSRQLPSAGFGGGRGRRDMFKRYEMEIRLINPYLK